MKKTHVWEVEEVDGSYLGIGEFWICHACGASGGPVMDRDRPPTTRVFLAGAGLYLDANNCNRAKKQIAAYNRAKQVSSD